MTYNLDKHRLDKNRSRRQGTIAVLTAVMLIPLLSLIALAIDYGYLLKIRTDLQRAADAASLAATQDLIPDPFGNQDLAAARATVRAYVSSNLNDQSFTVNSSDIEFGRFNAATVYSSVTLLNSGTFDAVRVTLRRDGNANPFSKVFFARVMGFQQAAVIASGTAVLQKAMLLRPGADILPFSISQVVWDARATGDIWSIYGDGHVEDDNGNSIPGNWGTVDIGPENNSTADLRDQILDGLRQSDLDALFADGRIPQDTHIDGVVDFWVQADPGLSSGIRLAVEAIHGEQRMIPIYNQVGGSNGNGNGNGNGGNGNGNNLEYHVVGWGVVTVVDSNWNGAQNTYVEVQKSYLYDSDVVPKPDLSIAQAAVEGAYTSPVLVQ